MAGVSFLPKIIRTSGLIASSVSCAVICCIQQSNCARACARRYGNMILQSIERHSISISALIGSPYYPLALLPARRAFSRGSYCSPRNSMSKHLAWFGWPVSRSKVTARSTRALSRSISARSAIFSSQRSCSPSPHHRRIRAYVGRDSLNSSL